MIKVIYNLASGTRAEKLDNFDLKDFYRLFLDGYDCPYYLADKEPEILIFDVSGIHPSKGLTQLFSDSKIYRDIVDDNYKYVETIKKYLEESLSLLDYSNDCKAILEVILGCENSRFLERALPPKLAITYYRAILLIMHQLKLKIVDNIDANKVRLCNYLINATLKKNNHRTYKLKDDITINIEYVRITVLSERDNCFSKDYVEMLAVKNKLKLVDLSWNECSLFDGLELALATNKLGEPSDILQIQVWYKREKCFYFKFTPFK